MKMENKNHCHNYTMLLNYVFLLLLSVPFATAQPGIDSPPPNPYLSTKFSPTMAITIIVLICVFFFMAFFSIYVRQCGNRDGGSVRAAIRGVGRSRRAARGLDPDVVRNFPTFLYSIVKGLKIGKGTLECAVCLNEFEDDETLRLLPKCDHVFHPECIDAWLATHTTCPVCRADLVPEAGEIGAVSTTIPISDTDSEPNGENDGSEIENSQNHISIRVIDDQTGDVHGHPPEVINPNQIPNQNRPARSKSTKLRFSGKFPRSHSTGHSLVRPGENYERFTLKLPENVRKQIVNGKLNRTTSCVVFPSQGSSRRGIRSGTGGDGSNRGKSHSFRRLDGLAVKSDRWVFSMAPPFFTRSSSVRSSWRVTPAAGEGTSTSKTSRSMSVKKQLDCLSPRVDGSEQSSPERSLV